MKARCHRRVIAGRLAERTLKSATRKDFTELKMTPENEDNSRDLQLARLEAKLNRRLRVLTLCAALAVAFVIALPVASSAPSLLPCAHSDLFCFASGEPARAAEVNSNFEALHQLSDALTSNLETRLPQSGGTITGSLAVNGALSVANGLPIKTSGPFDVTANHQTGVHIDLISTNRSMCFLQMVNLTGGGLCLLQASNGVWQLWASDSPTSQNGMVCRASCLQW